MKICSNYVSGQFKKSGFEKNAFKVLSTVKFEHLDIFPPFIFWYIIFKILKHLSSKKKIFDFFKILQ